MMSEDKVKVGDRVFHWEIKEDKYNECEFKKTGDPSLNLLEITKVPEAKPEIPDEPRTRGDVVTIEGDDEFIAVRFTGSDDMPYPFVASYSVSGAKDVFAWGEIVSRAAGRKIIVHKMVDPDEIPLAVGTYEQWLGFSEKGLRKYKWRDVEGDLWWYDSSNDAFLPEEQQGYQGVLQFTIEDFFPLTRDEKIDN